MRILHPFNVILGALLSLALLLAQAPAALAQNTHTLPLFMSASDMARQGFARIINRSDYLGTVTIRAIDDSGDEADPVTLTIAANATVHFNSGELEEGGDTATLKGLSGTTGSGEGNWRLKLETDLDIEPLAYIRTTADGFLTSIHDVAQEESMRWNVVIFNPGRNTNQKSLLRLINTSGHDTEVVVSGLDDQGNEASGEVKISLPADEARLYSALDLEDGHSDFEGSLGPGSGKWQLFVSADRPIQVMSLMSTPTGHMTNLSSTTRGRDCFPGVSDSGLRFALSRLDVSSWITDVGLESLTGLERTVCRTWLKITQSQVSDLSPLNSLTHLTRLELWENQISDLSPLSGLTALEWLNLYDNQISNLSPLSDLTTLEWLRVWNNQISDVSALVGLTALTELDLRDNQISNLSPLSDLTTLEVLRVRNNQMSDVSALVGLTALTGLDLRDNQISDLSPLSDLTALEWLAVGGNQTSDISALVGLTALTWLDLRNNQISDVSALVGLTALTELGLRDNQISNLSPLSDLTTLTGLDLQNNQISDLSPLSDLTALTELDLDNNQISDVSALVGLTALTVLDLDNNQISDIGPLVANAGLGDGDFVSLTNNPLSAESRNTHIPALVARGVEVRS